MEEFKKDVLNNQQENVRLDFYGSFLYTKKNA